MTQHPHHQQDDHRGGGHGTHHEAGRADLLDLDAQVLGCYLDEVTEWVGRHLPVEPRTVVDVGAGTGTGSLALAALRVGRGGRDRQVRFDARSPPSDGARAGAG